MAGPGEAHGRPRTVLFVLACTNWTLVGTEAVFERRERVVSVALHMPEMEAEVAAVTLHRSFTRLEHVLLSPGSRWVKISRDEVSLRISG